MSDNLDIPKFAIVGHPNQGKSSIVSTLTQDSEVPIGEMPGTTSKTSSFSIKVSGEVLFELFDTPGFQQPRKVLDWLKSNEKGADSRSYAVRQFALQEKHLSLYPDEVHLLKPIVLGAGIIYVVDASIPFGPEYEAELEILRWTGKPRMALINSTGEAKFLDSWKDTLNQFFNSVKIFNAQSSEFDKQLELLLAFSHIDENWKGKLSKVADILKKDRENKISSASNLLAEMISEMLSLKVSQTLKNENGRELQIQNLEKELQSELSTLEKKYRKKIEVLFKHNSITKEDENSYLKEEPELFSKESSELFGLKKTEVIKYAALTGAGLGGAFDIATGGTSLLLGSVLGGAIGAGTAFFAANSLAQVKIISLPLGKDIIEVGPIKDISFAFILLERARAHLFYTLSRNHAVREKVTITEMLDKTPPLTEDKKKKFIKYLGKIQKQQDINSVKKISEIIESSLNSAQD